jgi:anti-anti-sigma regulatory factor
MSSCCWLRGEPLSDFPVARCGAANTLPAQALAADIPGLVSEADRSEVFVDLANAATLSTLTLVALVKLRKKLLAQGRRLTLYNPQPAVEEVLEASKLNRWFAIRREAVPVPPTLASVPAA